MPPSSSSSSSPRRCRSKPAAATPTRDWAALPGDVLSTIFLKLGPCREIMRGPELACAAWRRAALEDPALWRRVDIDVGALVSAGLRKGWGAMVRAAVDRGAGRCESFSGPCDEELLLYLVERANSLKRLHVLCLDIPNEVLSAAVKKHPLLEDLELVYINTPSEGMLKSVCQSCPHLMKLKLSFSSSCNNDDDHGVGEELVLEIIDGGIPMMLNLQSLELSECDLTTKGLTAILDNCPMLESLQVTGSFEYYNMDDVLQKKCDRVRNLSIPKYSIHG